MTIPVRNLYYLLLYAYDALDEDEVVDAGALPETGIADLFAHVLDTGVRHLLRRGLDRGYVAHCETIPGIRGRLDVSATVKANTLTTARAICKFDELTADVTHNRLLRSTARQLMRVDDLDQALHDRLARLYRQMHGVSDVRLTARAFRTVQLHRNNRFYRFLLAVCRMAHDHLLADEKGGGSHFRRFEQDERRMRRLFERFVRNFFRREQSMFRVGSRKIQWAATGDIHMLPEMRTDVTLRSGDRVIVVETKYTANQLQEYLGEPTIRSDHLCQLNAYLSNMAKHRLEYLPIEGLLLYPRVGCSPNGRFVINGHPLRVVTLNLDQPWEGIHSELLTLLE